MRHFKMQLHVYSSVSCYREPANQVAFQMLLCIFSPLLPLRYACVFIVYRSSSRSSMRVHSSTIHAIYLLYCESTSFTVAFLVNLVRSLCQPNGGLGERKYKNGPSKDRNALVIMRGAESGEELGRRGEVGRGEVGGATMAAIVQPRALHSRPSSLLHRPACPISAITLPLSHQGQQWDPSPLTSALLPAAAPLGGEIWASTEVGLELGPVRGVRRGVALAARHPPLPHLRPRPLRGHQRPPERHPLRHFRVQGPARPIRGPDSVGLGWDASAD